MEECPHIETCNRKVDIKSYKLWCVDLEPKKGKQPHWERCPGYRKRLPHKSPIEWREEVTEK